MHKFWGLTLSILFLNLQLFSLGCSTLTTQPSYVLNAKTNWARSTLKEDYLGPKLIHSMAPTLIADTIYQGNAADGFVAIDQKSGHILWRKDVKNGVNSGAVEYKGVVYFGGNDGQFYALRASNGHIVWTFPTQAESLSAPILDGTTIYFLADNGTIYALDAGTGKMNWSYTQRDNAAINIRASASPVVDGAFVYVGFSDGTFSCFDKTKGFLKWERNLAVPQERFKDISSTSVIQGDSIYVSTYSGNLFSIKKSNGEINWKTEEGSPYSVTIEGNKVFYSTTNKKVLALDKQTGKELWAFNVKSGVATKPTYYKEMLIFGTSEGAVDIVSANDGKLIGHYSTGWGVSAPVAVNPATSDIYIMSNYGNIYSVNLKWQRPQQQWPWENNRQKQ